MRTLRFSLSLSLSEEKVQRQHKHSGEDPVGKGGLVERQAPPPADGHAAAQAVGHGAGVDGGLAQDRRLQAGRMQVVNDHRKGGGADTE